MSKGNRKRRRELGLYGERVPKPDVKCSARKTNGDPCNSPPMKGGRVCHKHGGSAPQVRRKAQERLLAASNDAAAKLIQLMQDKKVPYALQLRAAEAILDRAGIGPKLEIEVDVPWKDILISGIVAEVDEEAIARAEHYLTRIAPSSPREVENYVDAEVVEEEASARAEAERIKGRPASEWAHPPGSEPVPVPRQQPNGPRTRQANVRAD